MSAHPGTVASAETTPGVARAAILAYSVACYFIGLSALVYLILFIADLFVPVTITKASAWSPALSGFSAIVWNICLLGLWGAQHTIMARPAFKRWWTRVVPAVIERSTYLIGVTLVTFILVMLWVPMPFQIWNTAGTITGAIILCVYFFGWSVTTFATFLINHFSLFGLSQAWHSIRRTESKRDTFVTPLLYKLVRHPMMTGVLIALWAASTLTAGRLLFNIGMSVYILIGLYFEERTLVAELGDDYIEYQRTTPKLIPGRSTVDSAPVSPQLQD